jgi:hypothetical protein
MYNGGGIEYTIGVHEVSSQDCMPSLRLGLALWRFKEKKFLNFILHLGRSG